MKECLRSWSIAEFVTIWGFKEWLAMSSEDPDIFMRKRNRNTERETDRQTDRTCPTVFGALPALT
jgi:hypothetical protein